MGTGRPTANNRTVTRRMPATRTRNLELATGLKKLGEVC
jgi:hypothetical protein